MIFRENKEKSKGETERETGEIIYLHRVQGGLAVKLSRECNPKKEKQVNVVVVNENSLKLGTNMETCSTR